MRGGTRVLGSAFCTICWIACSSYDAGEEPSSRVADAAARGDVEASANDLADAASSVGAEEDAASRAAIIAAYCARDAACAPRLFEATWSDEAACRAAYAQIFPTLAGERPVSRARADACIAAWNAAPCGTFAAELVECTPSGLRLDGASCSSGTQCKGGSCKRASNDACGMCVRAGEIGESCAQFYDCQVGLHCAAGKCAARASLGAACTPSDFLSCASGLKCVAGKCVRASKIGDDCIDADGCRAGLVCADDKKCSEPPVAKIGEDCGVNGRGCGLYASCVISKCTANPGAGLDCNPGGCGPALVCSVGQKCVKELSDCSGS